jgi:hypothetical protein
LTAEADSVPHGWVDYSAAPTADDHFALAAHSADSVPDDYSPAVGSAAAGSVDYSAAPTADDHSALVVHSADSVPDDYSLAVGSAAAGSEDYSAAPMADDHSAPAAHSADSALDDCSEASADLAAAGSPDYSVAPDSSPDVHSLPADFPADCPADSQVGSVAAHSPVDLQDEPEAEPPACLPSPPALALGGRVRWLAAVSPSPAVAQTAPDAAPVPAASLRTTAAVVAEPSSQSPAGSLLLAEGQPRVLPCWHGLRALPPVPAQPPLANSFAPTPVAADPPAQLRDSPAAP